MVKFFLKIFLFAGILGFFIFGADFSLAVGAPTGLTPCGGEQPLAVLLDWSDQSVDHFELYYKSTDETNWQDRYPSISQYQVTGLSPEKTYQWYVVSCGDEDCADSAASSPCSFTTEAINPPPDGDGDGDGLPIELSNPLQCQTLACAFDALINFLFVLAMAVAPILIIYASFLILTAAGDAVKINKAKQIILWTVIAVAVVLLAKGIPSAIKGAFGG